MKSESVSTPFLNKVVAFVITIFVVSCADSEDEDPHEDWQSKPIHCPSHMIVHGK